jgi:hypothetical protein
MTTRSRQIIVRFAKPFLLPAIDSIQPAGEYRVDQDEDLIDLRTRLAWMRTTAFIHLPAIGPDVQTRQMVPIIPADLDAALEKDHTTS